MTQRNGIGLLVVALVLVPSWTRAQTSSPADPPPSSGVSKVEPGNEAEALSRSAERLFKDGKVDEAEKLFRSALAIRERTHGPDDPETARYLSNLAFATMKQGKGKQAKDLFMRSLSIRERSFGPEHLDVAKSHHDLGLLYLAEGEFKQGVEHMDRALTIYKNALGPEHPDVAQILNDVGGLCHGLARSRGEYRKPGKSDQGTPFSDLAERSLERALAIREKAPGPDDLKVADSLNVLAAVYVAQTRYDEAESLMRRALAIREKALGADDLEVARTIDQMIPLMRRAHFNLATIEETWSLRSRARAIRAKQQP
ncbi:MAG: tetratricopeptide repeat protein [Isosphaeraceae bacterium]